MSAETIIVGGGTAGCVLARRLADAGERVLLLESGGRYPKLLLGPPLASQRLRAYFSWNYRSAPQRALGGRELSLPLGRVLGGSSSTNAMMYCRGRASDYDRWASQGAEGWSFQDVLPYYQRLERRDPAGPRAAERAGFDVARPRFRAPFSEAFLAACEELGLDREAFLDGESPEGCGYFDVAQRHGERSSTAPAYLPPDGAGSRFRALTGARVTRVLLANGRATGVELIRDGVLQRAEAERQVLLCAGAAHSPQLLMLSGIGPADELRRLGVAPAVDLPGVGRNLQDHVRIPALYETPVRSPGEKRRWPRAAWDYLTRRDGVMTSNCCEAGAYVRSHPALAEPDLQFVTHFQHAERPGLVDLQFCLMSVRARGCVQLRSSDPFDPPRIDPGYLDHEADIEACLRGLDWARRLASAKALRAFPLGREYWPGAAVQSRSALIAYLRRSAEPCYHLAGSCKMGVDAMAVTDARLRVRGVDGLRVIDASVLPDLIHGNTMAPTVMLAEKAADLLLGASAERPLSAESAQLL